MRFSLNFVKEFVEISLSPSRLANILTMAGMEVESLKKEDGDWIFDIEVTSNRYDWLSLIGIAREIAACTRKKIKLRYPALIKKPRIGKKAIIIENEEDCSFYVGRIVESVTIRPSPLWLKEKIRGCGIKSINNAVDSTNYCMLKWGNPLHVFDKDKITGSIYIRRAKKGEVFVGIDEKKRELNKKNLVIADDEKIIALAGVMGAKNTEVDVDTKNIFLEAALFSPLAVRHSRREAGTDTESSYRFERRVNPDYLEYASAESAQLIQRLGKGVFSGYGEAGAKPKLSSKKLTVSFSGITAYLGKDFSRGEIKKILECLEFKIERSTTQSIAVWVPSFRFDIHSVADVYEEIARIAGYENIPSQIPFLSPQPLGDSLYEFKNEVRRMCSLWGLQEIITYSIEEEKYSQPAHKKSVIRVTNPLRVSEDVLRPSLLGGMCKVIEHNVNRNQKNMRFFEMGNIYLKEEKRYDERPQISLGAVGENSFFYLKGVVGELLECLGCCHVRFEEQSVRNFTNALSIMVERNCVGFLGKLDEEAKERWGVKEELFFAQLDAQALLAVRKEKPYVPFSVYPAISRDISIVLDETKKFRQVQEIINQQAEKYLADMYIVDVYEGKNVPLGGRSFTLRLFYQSKEKTLTAQEVDALHNNIREILNGEDGILLR